jgi:Uma2 family endonuclease
LSYPDYLALARTTGIRHEYLAGLVYAMAGGKPEHAALAGRVLSALSTALEGKPCTVYTSDLKIRINAADVSTYADVAVVCGELIRSDHDQRSATNPVVVVEVTSDSSEGYDRGEKFAHYRHLEALRDYVLISHRAERIEVYNRRAGEWVLREAGRGGSVELESVGVRLDVDAIYRNPFGGSLAETVLEAEQPKGNAP